MKTAEEFLDPDWFDGDQFNRANVCKHMIEFAKLHVEAALESAYKNAEFITVSGTRMKYSDGFGDLNKDSILNAYPIDLIK